MVVRDTVRFLVISTSLAVIAASTSAPARALNPQPEPPGERIVVGRIPVSLDATLKPGATVELNPQPIPPGRQSPAMWRDGGIAHVALNPQPLPPEPGEFHHMVSKHHDSAQSRIGNRRHAACSDLVMTLAMADGSTHTAHATGDPASGYCDFAISFDNAPHGVRGNLTLASASQRFAASSAIQGVLIGLLLPAVQLPAVQLPAVQRANGELPAVQQPGVVKH